MLISHRFHSRMPQIGTLLNYARVTRHCAARACAGKWSASFMGQSNGRPCAHAGLDSTKAQCVERHRLRQGEKCNLDCLELVRKTMQSRRRAAIESGLLVMWARSVAMRMYSGSTSRARNKETRRKEGKLGWPSCKPPSAPPSGVGLYLDKGGIIEGINE